MFQKATTDHIIRPLLPKVFMVNIFLSTKLVFQKSTENMHIVKMLLFGGFLRHAGVDSPILTPRKKGTILTDLLVGV